MDIFQKIKDLPILDVLDSFSIGYIKKGANYYLKKDDGTVDESFSISVSKNIGTDYGKSGITGNPFDLIAHLVLNVDPKTDVGKVAVIKAFVNQGLVDNPHTKKDFVQSYNRQELFDNFNDLKLGGYNNVISNFLITRGFTHDWIVKNKLKIGEVFADIGYYDNYFTSEYEVWKDEDDKWCHKEGDKPKTVGVFLFPCFNESKELIGIKLRRKDGKTINGKKSLAVGKTGLLYDNVSLDKQIIVEGETDYLVLTLLGFNNIVGNLGGVQSGRSMLKSLLSETSTIVCLYDNDTAGYNGKIALQETFKRPILEVEFPIRKDTRGRELSDVNDYYKVGYDNKTKWEKILATAKNLGEKENTKDRTDFIFLRSTLEYYDTKFKKIQQTGQVAAYLGQTAKELAKMVKDNIIKTYTDLCYHEGGKEGFYNTMDETIIIKHGGDAEPILHNHIEELINNICNNSMSNAEWLHKSILYKLTHINDPYVPALILFGSGGSGKGSLLNLLEQIFGADNMQTGLGQKDLEGSFDSYQGGKLVVEFKEISSGNKRDDKKILDRIKSMIGEKTISVNAKFQNVRMVDSKARFHFSSNHALPIQLDSSHSGNRRFTIIKTGGALDPRLAREMNEVTFKDKQVIREYIAWLYDTFPEVPTMTNFPALDNKDKRDLENKCEGVANLFFEWFEKKYPYITKISNKEKNKLLRMYCEEEGEDYTDVRYKQSNFDLGLSHRYEKKPVRINGKTPRGYLINKTPYDREHIPKEASDCFKEGEVENFIINY